MRILDRLPIPQADALAFVGAETIRVKRDQIVIWVSVTGNREVQLPPTAPRFPVIVDTGHTHNFSIQQQHLIRWAGIEPDSLPETGHIRHESRTVPLRSAKIWLHRNRLGQATVGVNAPFLLDVFTGIAVHPDDSQYPRLPLLGLRAIVSSRLHFTVDGAHATVTLRSADWRTWLLAWLA